MRTRKPSASSRRASSRAVGGSGSCRRRGRRFPARPSATQALAAPAATVSWKRAAISRAGVRREARDGRSTRGPVVSPKRHGYGSAGTGAGELLELDGGLPLVAHALADAEDRGHGVEQPAHPGRERRVELQALAHELPPCATAPASRRARGGPPRRATARGSPPRRPGAARVEVRQALESVEVAAQQLAAPERSVGAVPGAVEDERQRRALLAVLGETRGGVRVVVLDADELCFLLERPLRREVLRVEIVRDELGLDAEHREVEREIGAERACTPARSRGRRGGARGTPRPRRATQNVLLSSAPDGDDRLARYPEAAARRRVPARAADRERGTNDGVLAAAVDRPVVSEEGVGDPAQPRPRLVVLERDRLVGDIPARQHERTAEVGREQVVERRVREHDAEPRRPGRDRLGDRGTAPPPHEHDRPLARAEQYPTRRPRPRRARPARRSSARTASPRAACGRAASRRPPRSSASQARW